MSLVRFSKHWVPNFADGGSLDANFPNGDKQPTPRTIGWGPLTALIAALAPNQIIGNSFSHNVRQYLTGTGAMDAVITVSDAAWSISGDNLTNPGISAGSGSLTLTASIDGNTAVTSAIPWAYVTGTVTPPAANAVKWRPKHFIGTYVINALPSAQVSEVQSLKAQSGGDVGGIGLWVSAAFIEPTQGVYSGVATIKGFLDTLAAAGLSAWLFVVDDSFNPSIYYPSYYTGLGYVQSKAAGGATPKYWVPGCMDRIILQWQALGAQLNTHRALEMVSYRELDLGMARSEYAAAGVDSDGGNCFTQLHRWVDAVKAAFPNTNIGAPGNFSPGGEANAAPWVKYCFDRGVGISGPDTYPQTPLTYGGSNKTPTWTDQVIRGMQWNGSNWVPGGTDYRGKILSANQTQDPEMGRGYTWSPRAHYEYATSATQGLGQSHMYWWRKDYIFKGTNYPSTAAQTYWSSTANQPDATLRIKSVLSAGGHPMRATAPSFYNGNIDTAA